MQLIEFTGIMLASGAISLMVWILLDVLGLL